MNAYTVTSKGIAIACIVERTWREAEYIFGHRSFRAELRELEFEDHPLWDGSSPIGLREATPDEAARAHLARAQMLTSEEDGKVQYGTVIFLTPSSKPVNEGECEGDEGS